MTESTLTVAEGKDSERGEGGADALAEPMLGGTATEHAWTELVPYLAEILDPLVPR